MISSPRRRAAALVVALTATAAAVLSVAPVAGADEVLDDLVSTTTTVAGLVEEAVEVVAGDAEDVTGVTVTSTTTTTTTSTTSSTTTSTTTTTTTAPPAARAAAPPVQPPAPPPEAPAGAPGDAAAPLDGPIDLDLVSVPVFPWELEHTEAPVSLVVLGPRSTVDVIEVLERIDAPPQVLARVLAPFPVAGRASYADDWGAPRHGPPAHSHEGTDIFAATGTPVIASAAGTVTRMSTNRGLGGTSLRVTTATGTYFYYAHLDGFAPGLAVGQQVAPGDVLGFVGTTGNAAGGAAHLHFEIHPGGGVAVPPVPFLDRWLADARQRARAIGGAPVTAAAALVDVVPRPPVRAVATGTGDDGGPSEPPLDVSPASRSQAASHPLALMLLTLPVWWVARNGVRLRRRRHRRARA